MRALCLAAVCVAASPAMAQSVAPAGPDPREIPIPRIQGPLGNLPGEPRRCRAFRRGQIRAAADGRGNPR